MAEQLFEVFTPNKKFNGRRQGVAFVDGKGKANQRDATILVRNFKYSSPQLAALVQSKSGASNAAPVKDELGPVTASGPQAPPHEGDGEKEETKSPFAAPPSHPAPAAAGAATGGKVAGPPSRK